MKESDAVIEGARKESAMMILDGGMSTQLESMGHDISGSLWTAQSLLTEPDAIRAAHGAFIDAGAGVIITASYQVSRQGFVDAGLDADRADEALRRSVDVARAAAGDRDRAVLVAASVGPYGAILHDGSEYRGNYGLTIKELIAFHRPRIEVLVAAAPDLLAIETIPDVREAEALAEVLADFPGIRSWITFTARSETEVCAGQSIEEAVLVAASIPGVERAGINCTDPRLVPELLDRMASATTLPLIAYPNAGGTWNATTGSWDDVTQADIVRNAREWAAHGATWVGGCCGTDAAAIEAISRALRAE
jgi:homocysteine S-methyltransferase